MKYSNIIELESRRSESPVGPQGSGWFSVAPTMRVGGAGAGAEEVPLDALMCQTVLAKCLGPLSRWERVLQVARDAGYNMVHFTPLQVSAALEYILLYVLYTRP